MDARSSSHIASGRSRSGGNQRVLLVEGVTVRRSGCPRVAPTEEDIPVPPIVALELALDDVFYHPISDHGLIMALLIVLWYHRGFRGDQRSLSRLVTYENMIYHSMVDVV